MGGPKDRHGGGQWLRVDPQFLAPLFLVRMMYLHFFGYEEIVPVVPHKAVAEVSKIGNL